MAKCYTGEELKENGELIKNPTFFEKVKKQIKKDLLLFFITIVVVFVYIFLFHPEKVPENISDGFIGIILAFIFIVCAPAMLKVILKISK